MNCVGRNELNRYFLSFKHWFIDINKEDRHNWKIDGHSWQNEKFTIFLIKEQKRELEKLRKKKNHFSWKFDVG